MERNIGSLCFNFRYKEQGKKSPGSRKALNVEYKTFWDYTKEKYSKFPLFAGGKSMGGRVSTLVIDELKEAKGLVFLGFPMHAPGQFDKLVEDCFYKITHRCYFYREHEIVLVIKQ